MFRGLPASTATTTDASIRQSADPFPQSDRFSAFLPNGSAVWRAHRPTSQLHHHQTNGGNGVIRTTTRRRHADSQLLILQNPHRSQPRAPRCIQDRHRVNFFALAPTSGRAGRQIPRTARRNMATLKPTTPLHAPNKGPLKPPSPLRPQTAPKTLISHPQRRWRFQTHTGTSKQRRRRFQTTGPPRLQHPDAARVGGS